MWKTKKKQRRYYSGKKKRHTQKTQVIATSTGNILAVTIDKGRTHDFNLFKKSKATRKIILSQVLADLGYVCIDKICPNSKIPNKKTKKNPLSKDDKKENRKLSSKRIIKVFKIVKYPYRNRRKRFGLRMNLICAIVNIDSEPIKTVVCGDWSLSVLGEVY